jgi:hypothetical protein
MFIPTPPDPDLDFLPIQDPGVKKAPDPGSATLFVSTVKYIVTGDRCWYRTCLIPLVWPSNLMIGSEGCSRSKILRILSLLKQSDAINSEW